MYIPCGHASFASRVVSYRIGRPAPISSARDASQALGPNNYDEQADKGYVTLGCRGSLTLKFTRVWLVDEPGPDLHVFEIGPSVEPTKVEISKDGIRWLNIGRVSGGTASVDIGPHVAPRERFQYVRLTDLGTACRPDSKWPGADIDAVAALGCVKVQQRRDKMAPGTDCPQQRKVVISTTDTQHGPWETGGRFKVPRNRYAYSFRHDGRGAFALRRLSKRSISKRDSDNCGWDVIHWRSGDALYEMRRDGSAWPLPLSHWLLGPGEYYFTSSGRSIPRGRSNPRREFGFCLGTRKQAMAGLRPWRNTLAASAERKAFAISTEFPYFVVPSGMVAEDFVLDYQGSAHLLNCLDKTTHNVAYIHKVVLHRTSHDKLVVQERSAVNINRQVFGRPRAMKGLKLPPCLYRFGINYHRDCQVKATLLMSYTLRPKK